MSNNNTIAKFPRATTTINTSESDITLDSLVKTMENWRTHKQNRQEPIPEAIWDQIFILLDKFSENTLRSALNISGGQFRHKMQQRSEAHTSHEETPNSSVAIDFCKAQKAAPIYKPAKIPATHTVVVEFCRADGRIMKIHTTTESFAELMTTFFSEPY